MRVVDEMTAVPLWKAAERLGVQVEEIFDLIMAGRVSTVRRPNGRPLVDPAAVEQVLATPSGSDTPR